MNKKIWVKKSGSFKAAQEFDDLYYLSMSGEERLETVQLLREIYFKVNKGSKDAGRKRLRRVIQVIKQT